MMMRNTTTATSDEDVNAIRAAIALLESIGVSNLCLSRRGSTISMDILPPCTILGSSSMSSEASLLYHVDGSDVVSPSATTTTYYALVFNILASLLMVGLIALMSGLFLGLLTLEILDLQIIGRVSTDEKEKEYARSILPVVVDRHRLLVTLMIVDAIAYESLPLFLDNLVPSWMAVLLSTTLILLFGEILPSGIFMGPNQLYLGHLFIPVAKFFLWFLYPIAVPLGRFLDMLTDQGPDGTNALLDEEYSRDELIALVQIQHERRNSKLVSVTTRKEVARTNFYHSNNNMSKNNNNNNNNSNNTEKNHASSSSSNVHESPLGELGEESAVEQLHPPLHQREVDMVEGALTMKTQTAMDVYTPYRNVYAVPDNLILTKSTITEIYSHGYSRVPVYRYNPKDPDDTTAVLGFFITRQLMLIDWDDGRRLGTLPLQRPVCVSPKTNLVELFEILQTNGLLLTFVCASPLLANKALKNQQPIPSTSGIMGICTLVDVMESILQDRIYDEGDVRERDRAVAILQQWASGILKNFLLKTARTLKRQRSITNTNQFGTGGTNERTPLLWKDDQAEWDGAGTESSASESRETQSLLYSEP